MKKSKNVSVSTSSSETESDSSETPATDSAKESDSESEFQTSIQIQKPTRIHSSDTLRIGSQFRKNSKSENKKRKSAFEIFSGQEWNRINGSRKDKLQRGEFIELSKVNLSF